MPSVYHPYQKITMINYNAFPSVLVLYYNLVSSEFADMEDIDNEVGKEDKREDIASGLQQLELDDAQEKIK